MEKQTYIAQAHFTDTKIGAVTRKDRLQLTEEHAAHLGALVKRQPNKVVEPEKPVPADKTLQLGTDEPVGGQEQAESPPPANSDGEGKESAQPAKKVAPKPKK